MKKLFFLLAPLAITFWSCSSKSNTEVASDKLLIDLEITDSLRWEDLFQEVEVISLEFTEESMLTGVDNILIQDDSYLVFDKKAQVLYRFDHGGKYLSKLDKSGEGPDEYHKVYDVDINPYTGNMELISAFGSMFIYDKNFEWVDTFDFPDITSIHKFGYFSEDIILLYTSSDPDHNLMLYSRSEKKHLKKMKQPERSIFERTKAVKFPMLQNPIVNSPEGLLFCVPLYNSVYRIELDGLEFDYQWDFGKYVIDEGGIKEDDPEEKIMEHFKNILKNGFSSLLNYFENEKLIFGQFLMKGKMGSILYHKDLQVYKVLYDHVPDYSITILNDGFIGPTNSIRLPLLLKNSKSDFAFDEIENSTEENNPYLLKYTFNNEW